MKRIIFIIITLITLGQMSARERYEGCIYLSAEKNGDTLDCTLHNETNDTIYLFYSYLKGAFGHSPRYCPEEINRYGENDYESGALSSASESSLRSLLEATN